MSGISSYDMSGSQVNSLILALEGNEEEKVKWLETLRKWVDYRNRQLKILKLTEEWLTAYAIKTCVHVDRHDWRNDEENLKEWVYHQMEYAHGLTWDEKTQKVVVNKYSQQPLLSAENTQNLLDYLTGEI